MAASSSTENTDPEILASAITGKVNDDEWGKKKAPMMKFGFPSYDTLRIRKGYVVSYDKMHRNPKWVMEHVTKEMLEGKATRKSHIKKDETILEIFRATDDDYEESGYDRGHLAAANNYKNSQEEMDDTFIYSNITPKNENFNRGIWKTLENHVRTLAKDHGNVSICSGPLYLPRTISDETERGILELLRKDPFDEEWKIFDKTRIQSPRTLILRGEEKITKWVISAAQEEDILKYLKEKRTDSIIEEWEKSPRYVWHKVIGEHDVAVPTHFFKAVVTEFEKDKYDMEAYIMPNKCPPERPKKREEYMVPREVIEKAAGFLLFHKLPLSAFRKINGEDNKVYGENKVDENKVKKENEVYDENKVKKENEVYNENKVKKENEVDEIVTGMGDVDISSP